MAQGAGPDPSERPTAEATAADAVRSESSVPLTFAPTVTLFFSDIRGFTEYTDSHGDAAAFRMLQYHNTMVQEQIALYGGHIVKTLGDSYMVSFNAARNAMACGIGIQKSLAQYNEREAGAKINIGIGINMGEPILDADDFFGGSVNLAARICAAAGPGEILVSEGVRHVVGKMEGTDYIDRGYFELKGFHEPQHLYAVDWSGLGAAMAAAPLTPPATSRPQVASAGAATTPPAPAVPSRRPSRLPIVFGVIVLAAVVLVGAIWSLRGSGIGPFGDRPAAKPQLAKPIAPPAASPQAADAAPAGPSPQAAKPAAVLPSPGASSTGRLLFADDFSDPARGLFPTNQQGAARITGDGSAPLDFQGSYAYQGGALVGRLIGDHPGGERAVFGRTLLASGTVSEDFAVEVRGRVTGSPNVARFGVQFVVGGPAEFFTFSIHPGAAAFNISRTANQVAQSLTAGRTTAMRPPPEDNLLRVEVRGDTARLFVNGQEAGLARHESFGKRGGQLGLNMAATGQLINRTAEVQLREFKVFALAP